MSHRCTLVLLLTACLALMGCGQQAPPEGIDVSDDFEVTIYAEGFEGPTQMVLTPDGDLLVAELNGGENDQLGRVWLVSADDADDRVLLQEDLDKPTGIALVGDRLWIMERRRLSVTSVAAGAQRQVVLDEMPFNGRSQGTLTVTPSGSLLFDTSGSKRGPDRVPGSGTLFAIDDAASGPSEPRVVATGFKHAYAHLVDPTGQLWTVEMTDGNFDGVRAADELVALEDQADGGWPQCVDNNRPVAEFGGTEELCAASPPSHALFGVGATPTSLALAPWDSNQMVATLWLTGDVVTVPLSSPIGGPHEPTVFITGIESPQHLIVIDDQLLVSDHATGQIFAVTTRS